ncbi:hypothetical protein KSP40_PGU018822 [Platanthera guangdongensis]|uniref:Uncharacterized protein n=1 Tax=Platanthera guangdongensis TaxID=2320717 RepID=A0ABR2N5X7_9ASPA
MTLERKFEGCGGGSGGHTRALLDVPQSEPLPNSAGRIAEHERKSIDESFVNVLH